MALKSKGTRKPSVSRTKRGTAAHSRRQSVRLRDSAELLRLAREAVGIVTWSWNVTNDQVRWFGDPAQMLGLPAGSFSGRFDQYLACVHPDDRAGAREVYVSCLKGKRPTYRAEERVVWPDGTVRWIETYGRARYDRNGRALELSGTLIDCTERKRQEQEIARSRTLLDNAFATSPDYMVFTRLEDAVILNVNATFERLSGYSREEAIGRPVIELVPWVRPDDRLDFVAALRKSGSIRDFPSRLRLRGGREFDCLISAFVVDYEDKAAVFSIVRDMTDAKLAAERERMLHGKYAALFDTSPSGTILTRPSQRMIVEINDAALRVFGVTREQAVGARVVDLVAFEDLDRLEDMRNRALASDETQHYDACFTRADGVRVELMVSQRKVEIGGEPHLVICMADVTEQRRQQRVLAESEERFQKAFQSSHEAIGIARLADGRIVSVNRGMETLYEAPAAEMIGRTTVELDFWPGGAPERAQVIGMLRSQGRISNLEVRMQTRRGAIRDCSYSSEVVEIGGEPHAIVFLRDVTVERRQQRILVESEERFHKAFSNSHEAICVSRLSDGLIAAVNPGMEALYGSASGEMVGRTTHELKFWTRGPDMRNKVVQTLRAEGRIRNLEVPFRTRDGSLRTCDYSATLVDIGEEPHAIVFLRDVTELRAAEAARRESEQRYRHLFEEAPDGIALLDPQGRLLDANPTVCRETGYSRGELVGDTFSRLVEPGKFPRMIADLNASLVEGGSRFEVEIYRRDGSTLPVEIRAGWLSPGVIQVFMRDMSERKRSEQLLMNLARGVSAELGASFFRSLMNHLSNRLGADFAFIGEIVGDAKERVRTLAVCADGAEQPNFDYALAGSPCINAITQRGTVAYERDVADLFPDDAGLKRLGMQGYVGTSLFDSRGEPLGIMVIMSRSPIEHVRRWSSILEIFASRAAAEIERARAEARVNDLNVSLEQRVQERTAELEDANRELESYNFSISHDLRQPLNAIAGFAELLRDHASMATEPLALECLEEIEGNAQRMEKMIEALLRLSRAGRGALQRTGVDVIEMVDAVLRDAAAGAPLSADIRVGSLPPAQGDPVLLRQVWANLVGNALKYSRRADAPRIEIRGHRREGWVEYTVSDNGVGFDMRDADRVFEPFHRLPTASPFEGSGVGLAIVQRIVRRHGGTITAVSRPGEGATFRFALPD